ncbi:MAG TPA: carbonic anhydrase [Vicinamibacterales bacterium]|nr:carbonic anhydrase [Vicinamibacterales bacterium]
MPLSTLLSNNRAWAADRTRQDPNFFQRLCGLQTPEYLWIGCADSRVPANEIVGLAPGELFVHRNIANVVSPDDVNCVAVVQYAIDVLKVKHVIVTGHYGCGGVEAALGAQLTGPLDRWIQHVRDVRSRHMFELERVPDHESRWRRLCELNVMEQVNAVCQVESVRAAWRRNQPLLVHGWIYDLRDGLLQDLHVTRSAV